MSAERLRLERLIPVVVFFFLALASVGPLIVSGSFPAFQHDWAWPASREATLGWLASVNGQWSAKGLGQPNLLALQTYVVAFISVAILCFGPSLGLTVFLVSVELVGFIGMESCAREFGLKNRASIALSAVAYVFGPTYFTRVQAGHLAYLVAYAMLPWICTFASRANRRGGGWVLALGAAYALAISQIQFAFFGIVAALLGVLIARPYTRTIVRIGYACLFGLVLQLQGIVPLLAGSARTIYGNELPYRIWEYNNSVPLAPAALGLGYFAGYYEAHAIQWAWVGSIISLASAIAGLAFASPKLRVVVAGALLFGIVWSSGLYGPFHSIFLALSEHVDAFTLFRDFGYASVFVAFGCSLGLAACGERLGTRFVIIIAPAIFTVVFPSINGLGLAAILAPRHIVDETVSAQRIVARNGPGRVLWLPSDGSVGPRESRSRGLDIAQYDDVSQPSANWQRESQAVAYATQQLRRGLPNVEPLRRLGIRYVITRDDVVVGRGENMGVPRALAFAGLPDDALDAVVAKSPHVRRIASIPHVHVYELLGATSFIQRKRAVYGALRFSQLSFDDLALLRIGELPLQVKLPRDSPDPRFGWIPSYIGVYLAPLVPDAIYPQAITQSEEPLTLHVPRPACIAVTARGSSRIHTVVRSTTLQIVPDGTTAVSGTVGESCEWKATATRYDEVLAAYDAQWRAIRHRGLEPPVLADGWAMAWKVHDGESLHLIYLPQIEQDAAFLFSVVFALVSWRLRRSLFSSESIRFG